MDAIKILRLLGAITGSIAAVAAIYGSTDPNNIHVALLTAGIVGGLGSILNAISHFLGGGDVVPMVAPPVQKLPATETTKPSGL